MTDVKISPFFIGLFLVLFPITTSCSSHLFGNKDGSGNPATAWAQVRASGIAADSPAFFAPGKEAGKKMAPLLNGSRQIQHRLDGFQRFQTQLFIHGNFRQFVFHAEVQFFQCIPLHIKTFRAVTGFVENQRGH